MSECQVAESEAVRKGQAGFQSCTQNSDQLRFNGYVTCYCGHSPCPLGVWIFSTPGRWSDSHCSGRGFGHVCYSPAAGQIGLAHSRAPRETHVSGGARPNRGVMKRKLLLVAVIATNVLIPAAVRADRIEIEAGDRPYFIHGPRYWDREYEMVWVPGHWSRYRHRWVHGHYVRGERRRHDWRGRHDDRYDDRHDDHRDDDRR
jgi:hypothetical protein